MAISDTQKNDVLYKKLVFGVTKTDVAGNKSPSNEAIPSPLLVRGDTLWNQSGLIPQVPPTESNSVVMCYTGESKVAPSSDPTVVPATRTWITNVQNWIPPQFGAGYTVKVYADNLGATNPSLTGTLLAPDGINNDAWLFDYQAGVLNFADTNIPAALSGKTIYIVGYQYVGTIGIGAGQNYGDLTIVGNTISTSIENGNVVVEGNGTGSVVLNDNTAVNGTATVNGAIISTTSVTAPALNGNVTSTGTSTFSNIDVNGGAIDGTTIGATTPAAATFTTVTGGEATFSSINNTPIGNAVPSTGAFTTLAASGLASVTDSTDSTLSSNGALVVAGGVGIAKNLNVNGNVVVTGDLTVQGTTTTVNSTDVAIADVNITVAKNATTGAQADGAGLTVAGANATIIYDGSTDTWNINKDLNAPAVTATATTQATSSATGALVTAGGAGVAKDLYVGGTLHGAVQTANLTATGGTVSVTSVSASVVTTANAQISGGAITSTPFSGSTVDATTLTTANAQVTGGAITGATVTTPLLTTANAQVTGGNLTNASLDSATITNSSVQTANLIASGGTITGVAITNSPISGNTGSFTTLTTSDAQISGGVISGVDLTASKVITANAQVTGGAISNTPISGSTGSFTELSSANVSLTGGNATSLTNVSAVNGTFTNLASGNVDLTGGTITNTPISGSTGSFTSLTASSFTADSINNTPVGNAIPSTGSFTTFDADSVSVTDTTQSTASDNGALIVAGGVGIAKNLNVGGNAIVTGNLTVNGSTTIVNSSDLSTTDRNITLAVGATNNATADGAGITVAGSGAEITYDGSNDTWNLNKKLNAPVIASTDATDATSSVTGALVTAGGAGVAKDLYVGGTIHGAIVTGNAQITGGDITNIGTFSATDGDIANLTSGNVALTGGTISGAAITTANLIATGGAISATPISGSTGSFTTLASSGEAALNSVVTANAQITGGSITGTPFSGSTVSAVSVTTADAQITGGAITSTPISGSTVSATVLTTANAQVTGGDISSTPISGSTGSFTTLSASAGITGTLQTNAQPNVTTLGTLTTLTVSGATSTGALTSSSVSTANAQVTGGAITNTPISGSTGSFTNLTASSFTADSINNTPVGNAIPSTGAFTTLASNDAVTFTSNVQSTTTANGALVVAGGVGIAKNLNVGGNTVIDGDLTVNGTTTTVSSATLDVTDKNITVAKGAATAIAADGAGLTVDGPAAATILYSSTTDTWDFNKDVVAATFVGNVQATTANIATVTATNIGGTLTTAAQPNVTSVGTLTSVSVAGDVLAGSVSTANVQVTGGAISSTVIDATSLTTSNVQVTGGAISGVAGSFTTLAASSSFTANTTGAVVLNSGTVGSIDKINIGATTPGTGNFTSLTANSATFDSINNTPIGNAIASTGAFTTVDATDINTSSLDVSGVANITTANVSGVLTANAASFGGAVVTNAAMTTEGTFTANAATILNGSVDANSAVTLSPVTGLVTIAPTQTGSISNMDISAVSLSTANAVVTGGSISGTPIAGSTGSFTTLTASSFIADSINNTPIGNATPSTGAFTTLAATSGITGVLQTNAQPNINSVGELTSLDVAGIATVGALTTASATITGGAINNTIIGNVTPAAGTFTTMNATNVGGTLSTAAQPNVTSVGTLTSLSVSGTVSTGALTSSSVSTANAQVSGGTISNTPISGSTGNFTSVTTGNAVVTGGAISNTPIAGSTGSFTTLTASNGTVTNFASGNVELTGGDISGVAITSSTGSFTTLSGIDTSATNFATSNAHITGGAISSTPISGSTGSFTTLSAGATTLTGEMQTTANVESVSTTTGTIVVTGGVGMSGNVHVGNGAFINANKSAQPTIIKGVNDESLVYANATTNQVIIGGNVVSEGSFIAGAKFQVKSTDSMMMPVGTSGQRPSTPTVGMTRFNSTYNQLEFWNGSIWASTETVFTLITDQQFTGDNLTDTFFLTAASTTNSTIVSINGVVQIPGLAYSVAGTTLQFSEPPLSTDVIDVRVLVTTQTINGLASPSGFNQVIPDDNEIGIWTGTSSSSKKWKFDAATGSLIPVGAMDIGTEASPVDNIFASNVIITGGSITGVSFNLDSIDSTTIGATVSAPGTFTGLAANAEFALQQGAAVTYNEAGTSFGTSPTVIDSFDATLFRTAKYVISVSNGTAHQAAEVLVTHDGSSAYSTTYGVVTTTGPDMASFVATYSDGIITLQATGTAAGNVAKVQKTYIAIPADLPGVGGIGAGGGTGGTGGTGPAPGTYATLVDGKIPVSELPAIAISNTFVVSSAAAMTALTAEVGDVAVRTDVNESYILAGPVASTLGNWQKLLTPTATNDVTSVNGQTGAVSITDITGNAATATTLATARNIALTGDVTGTVSFDGSGDASIATTLKGDVVQTVTVTGTLAINYASGSYVVGNVTGATTLSFTGVPDSTRAYGLTLELTNAGTNITWPASVVWLGTAPTLRASGVSMVTLVTRNGGTTWLGSAA